MHLLPHYLSSLCSPPLHAAVAAVLFPAQSAAQVDTAAAAAVQLGIAAVQSTAALVAIPVVAVPHLSLAFPAVTPSSLHASALP